MTDVETIRASLKHPSFYQQILCFPVLDSTSTYLKNLPDAPDRTAVIAERQTAGRGRLGRSYHSAEGGLYVSILLRPDLPPDGIQLLTPCAGVCVCQAIQALYGLSPEIKWVNDPQIGGKKICGILAESVLSGDRPSVVVGIGINVNQTKEDFPEDLRETATSLLLESGGKSRTERLAAELMDRFAEFVEGFPGNLPEYRRQYRNFLNTLGREIYVVGENRPAAARELDPDFGLIIEYPDGTRRTLRSGEVSIRPCRASSGNARPELSAAPPVRTAPLKPPHSAG